MKEFFILAGMGAWLGSGEPMIMRLGTLVNVTSLFYSVLIVGIFSLFL